MNLRINNLHVETKVNYRIYQDGSWLFVIFPNIMIADLKNEGYAIFLEWLFWSVEVNIEVNK